MCTSQELLCPGSRRPSPCLLQNNREAGTRADRCPTQRPPKAWLQHTALSSLAPRMRTPLQAAPAANRTLLTRSSGKKGVSWKP